MTVRWSAYAKSHYRDIILGFAFARSAEDAERWEAKIDAAVAPLWDYPDSGKSARKKQFLYIPDNFERLKTISCRPYVFLYEHRGDECHILDSLYGRQLFDGRFAIWNESVVTCTRKPETRNSPRPLTDYPKRRVKIED